MQDMSGQAATGRDTGHTLTIQAAAHLYAEAGHPRTSRTIQRYCASGHLDCVKVATTLGDKYLISELSLRRHLAQIEELQALDARTAYRDESRPVATFGVPQSSGDAPRPLPTMPLAVPDQQASNDERIVDDTVRQDASPAPSVSRPDATRHGSKGRGDAPAPPTDTRYVEQLEHENGFLRDQIVTKDGQIAELSERARETNFLIKGLQELFLQLQPGRTETPRLHIQPSTEPSPGTTANNAPPDDRTQPIL